MDRELEKRKKKEAMEPIMMDDPKQRR